MRPAAIFLLLLVALWGTLGATWTIGDSGVQQWQKHPNVKKMLQARAGSQRHEPLLLYGWLFGAFILGLFVACLGLGVQRRGRLGKLGWGLLAGALVYVGVFTMMILAYRAYAQDPNPAFSGPFPAPTAWMLFGMWAAPLVFVVLYVAAFPRWIYTPDDQRRFEELLAARRQREGADD